MQNCVSSDTLNIINRYNRDFNNVLVNVTEPLRGHGGGKKI